MVAFVAIVLGLLGALMIGGFVMLHAKIGALADELRDARGHDAAQLGAQLTEVASKLQGVRLDLEAHRQSIDGLAQQIEGPLSMRHPPRNVGV
jgi:hypothetical protein